MPAPSRANCAACSYTVISMPTRRSAAAVASPPMPAPIIAIDRSLDILPPGFSLSVRPAEIRPAPVRRGHRIMRARLIPVTVGSHAAEQPVDQDAGAGALVAVDHDAGGIGERGAHRLFGTQ